MSKSVVTKQKAKKYFMKQSFNKKPTIEFKLKGFLCSCNNREKDCIKEAYNLLNEYADKLYPLETKSDDKSAQDEQDISDSLTKEISDLKEENVPSKKKFQLVDSGAKNFLFIRTTIPSPVKLAEAIMKDIQESGNQRTKFLLRLIPVETTCKASISDISNAFAVLAEKYFKEAPQTFCVIFNHRNNNAVSRDEVIKTLANIVLKTRTDHKVDLKTAQLAVIVEVIKGVAFLSVVPNYFKYKKYNLLSICKVEKAAVEASDVDKICE